MSQLGNEHHDGDKSSKEVTTGGGAAAAAASAAELFNTDVDVEAELEEMRRQVDDLQEDLQLKTLQEQAARDEGTRKSVPHAQAASALTSGTSAAALSPSSSSAAAAAANAAGGGKASVGNTSVFVNGLDVRASEADLRVFFSTSGTIERVTVLKDRYTGQPKGTAYIEFATPEQAQAALLKDGQSLHGKPLKVAPKRDNVPAFQRGGRGGVGGAGMLFMPPAGMAAGAGVGGVGGGYYGRGGRGGGAAGNAAALQQQQQLAAMAMMATMMTSGVAAAAAAGYSPYGASARGRGRGAGARGGPRGGGGGGGAH